MGQTASKSGVVAWGSSEYGQLGLAASINEKKSSGPSVVEALKNVAIRHVACGRHHSCAVAMSGELYAWGNGRDGQLGHSEAVDCPVPRLVRALQGRSVCHVSCGIHHTAITTEEGFVYTWGRSAHGRLGRDVTAFIEPSPALVKALTGMFVEYVSCGGFHTLFLATKPENAVYACGLGLSGRLGTGDEQGALWPIKIDPLAHVQVVAIACASHHSACVTKDGHLYTWGGAAFGKLGHGPGAPELLPKRVRGALEMQAVVSVSLGPQHSACCTRNGNLYTWGQAGRLGHATQGEADEHYPRQVVALSGLFVDQVSCGTSHTVATTDTGEVWAWGTNRILSHQDAAYAANKPTLLQSLGNSGIVQVSCGASHTLALSDYQTITERSTDASKALRSLGENPLTRMVASNASPSEAEEAWTSDSKFSLYTAFRHRSTVHQWASPLLSNLPEEATVKMGTHYSLSAANEDTRIHPTHSLTSSASPTTFDLSESNDTATLPSVSTITLNAMQPSKEPKNASGETQKEDTAEDRDEQKLLDTLQPTNWEPSDRSGPTAAVSNHTLPVLDTHTNPNLHHLLCLASNQSAITFYKEMNFLTSKLRSMEQQNAILYISLRNAVNEVDSLRQEKMRLIRENSALREEVKWLSVDSNDALHTEEKSVKKGR